MASRARAPARNSGKLDGMCGIRNWMQLTTKRAQWLEKRDGPQDYADSWAITPAWSQFCQASTKRPSLTRTMYIPVKVTTFPEIFSLHCTFHRSDAKSPSESETPG